jgi:LmbE family N-acetylglucosaminyl deacetylase
VSEGHGVMARIAVLAPHPDDEVLGCASLLAEHDAVVVHATDGVPPNMSEAEAATLRAARADEARKACEELGAHVERFVTLDARDQELWSSTDEVAAALVVLLPTLDVRAVYVPAFQSGHPDHDGLYVAAQLARRELGSSSMEWYCYALYALDERGRPGYGWLHPGLFADVTERVFSAEELERKARALRQYVTQVSPGSVVQSWLDAPVNERFAPLPPMDAPMPLLRSYYDEIFNFREQGIDRGKVDRVLRAALAST